MGEEETRLVRRILTTATKKYGSAARLAEHLNVTYAEFGTYIAGKASPPEKVLLRAVEVILDEVPAMRREFSKEAWRALRLP